MTKRIQKWLVLMIGAAGGLGYGYIESLLDKHALGKSADLTVMHDILDWTMPLTVGLSLALVVNMMIQHKELNRKLSSEMASLKSKILTNTFASFILHEIRNPIHNLNAVLGKHSIQFPREEKEILERNMQKLAAITDQLKHMHVLADHMNVSEETAFSSWFDGFLTDSVEGTLKQFKIRFEKNIASLKLKMHPLLLEQCFLLLFDNAVHAAKDSARPQISIQAALDQKKKDYARITLKNSGTPFPEEVIRSVGTMKVASERGSGLGLVLVTDTVKHVGGELAVENAEGLPQVSLLIPVEGNRSA